MLPNVRKLFLPDLGFVIADADLDRADLQVVVWEAEDADLKRRLRLGVDLHLANAIELEGLSLPPEDELVETSPHYSGHLAKYKVLRKRMKSFIHGTNYGGSARTMAKTIGVDTATAERYQRRWFGLHPGIRRWHDRTLLQLQTNRQIYNKFGFRRFYFDRIESCFAEALAWVPQSTVALVINYGLRNLYRNMPEVELLLQVHDSLTLQYLLYLDPAIRPKILANLEVIVPYDDPLVIPAGLKVSPVSWGDVK